MVQMLSLDKKWLPLLCMLSLPVHSANVPASNQNSNQEKDYVDNNVLTKAAEQGGLVEQSVFLDIASGHQRQILVGEYGRILMRSSNDTQWLQADVPVQTTMTAVAMTDENIAWAVGHQGVILKSQDGGKIWQKRFDGIQLAGLLKEALEQQVNSLKVAFEKESNEDNRDELEMLLDDATYKLEDMTADTGIEIPFFDILFITPSYGLVVGAYGAMLETKDAGNTWHYIGHKVPNPDGYHLNALAKDAKDNIYIVGEAGIAMSSSDLGDSWQPLGIDYQGSLFGVTTKNAAVYSYGLRGNMFVSEDRGETWNGVDTGVTNHIFSADWLSNGELLLVGAGGLKLIYDGQHFNNISQPTQRIDLTSVKVMDEQVLTTSLNGWQSRKLSETLQGGSE
jgi:photosystem II stability/assembly factor-like uncharacterized protein